MLHLVANQIVGVSEAGSIAVSVDAARNVALDLGIAPSRNFWLLFNAAAGARVHCLIERLEESRKK